MLLDQSGIALILMISRKEHFHSTIVLFAESPVGSVWWEICSAGARI